MITEKNNADEEDSVMPGIKWRLEELVETHKTPIEFAWPGDISLDEVEPDDLVNGMIAPNTLCCFYAPPGTGKTFLALDMAAHIARGIEWHEREVEQGGVVYIGLEGRTGVRRRIKALKKEGLITDETPLVVSPSFLDMRSQENIKNWISQVKEQLESRNETIKLVIIDTLMRAMSGGDFNSGTDMSSAVARGQELIEGLGCTVLIIHHCGKDTAKKELGHTSFRAALDSSIFLSQEGGLIKVQSSKQKDMQDDSDQDIYFKLKRVHIGFTEKGKDLWSCVVERGENPKDDENRKKYQNIQFIKEDMLDELDDKELTTTEWDTRCKDCIIDLSKGKVAEYRKELLAEGKVKCRQEGNKMYWSLP